MASRLLLVRGQRGLHVRNKESHWQSNRLVGKAAHCLAGEGDNEEKLCSG